MSVPTRFPEHGSEEDWRESADQLNTVAHRLKAEFVRNDDLIELMLTSAIAREPILILGPPGAARSSLITRFVSLCGIPSYFPYMLTRFTEPEEIFGPLDLRSLEYLRQHRGPMQEADVVFLDEVFRGSSAILNVLMDLVRQPRILTVGAAQELPPDLELITFCDQFVVRFWSGNVADEERGLRRQFESTDDGVPITTPKALVRLNKALKEVRLNGILEYYKQIVTRAHAGGLRISDRRIVKSLQFVKAAALLRRSDEAAPADLWVCKHMWDTTRDISILRGLVDGVLSEAGRSGDALSEEDI